MIRKLAGIDSSIVVNRRQMFDYRRQLPVLRRQILHLRRDTPAMF